VCLASALLAERLLVQLRHDAGADYFAVLAYCFMPDHVHLVLEGLSEAADLRRCVARWKQATGHWYKQKYHQTLWMSGYYDRILHDGESTLDAVRYAMSNPIRARLASRIGE
jgi:putative transposase